MDKVSNNKEAAEINGEVKEITNIFVYIGCILQRYFIYEEGNDDNNT